MNVVVVESPAKAKTINKYLGSNYTVLASYGHVRDLPSKDGSVEPDADFVMHWKLDTDSRKRVSEIEKALKKADRLILATDPDREGEAISWHVREILEGKGALKNKEVERVVFNEITKSAILDAMNHPREIDGQLVDAYLARRALDYLVGFTLSPVLWRKLPGSRSAGRVQSVALRLICERELEIEAFKPQEYWNVVADVANQAGKEFQARLTHLHGEKLDKFSLGTDEKALSAAQAIEASELVVSKVESKPTRRNPQPPFTTSTLQQEASRKLGFSASRTMQVAQKLYEGVDIGGETQGLITYMRTDGVSIAQEALVRCRDVILEKYGDRYLPDRPREYKSKAKNAQEAHEAIRPTDLARTPGDAKQYLNDDQFKLYDLIWKRTVASQMDSAILERTTVDIVGGDAVVLRATGSVLKFDGFLTLYQEGKDDSSDEDGENRLPAVKEAENLDRKKVTPSQHFTEPPPRYSEATLVKKMEELGIGRPSTYASILSVLRDRNYVVMDKNRFIPEDKGRLVTAFLESYFTRYVEYEFTAKLEEELDYVSDGKLDYKILLRNFWNAFTENVNETTDLRITEVLDKLNEILGPHVFPEKEDGSDPRACPSCDNGRLSLKVGRFGAFIGCSNYPECKFTRQMAQSDEEAAGAGGDVLLGVDNETGSEIWRKSGRFGPYVQMTANENMEKPKNASIPREYAIDEVDLEFAKKLLSLPRLVGMHPETGEEILAGLGRYGPYLLYQKRYINLASTEEVLTIGLNHAVTAIAEAPEKRRRGPTVLHELGKHPDDDEPVTIMSGQYGAYANHGKVNATLPRGVKPEDVTFEQALELIAAKAAKGTTKKKSTSKKTAAKKTTAKKTSAKKSSPKKKATVKKSATAEKAATK